ncbi:MAG: aminoglycoside phosphotransferase family protein [Ruminococcaceae bacterium]|nr:aminoglycoside phosphotransferase family protein [Oscillospiraceae bacterium]
MIIKIRIWEDITMNNENTSVLGSVAKIAPKFGIKGEAVGYKVFTDGHINNTYRIDIKNGEELSSYIFQKINLYVFKNPHKIMSNIALISEHIKNKGQTILNFHSTEEGLNYYISGDGSFWRVYDYIEGIALTHSDDMRILSNAGKGFGRFQNALSDFDASLLYETIPDFHHTGKRVEHLYASYEEDACKRASAVEKEMAYVRSIEEKVTRLSKMSDARELPLRVTHNDTKISNVLFDEKSLEPVAVMDLDTVMPGLPAYDFGDAIRASASECSEDERDPEKIRFSIERYRAIVEGFIPEVISELTEEEIRSLPLGAFTMTAEVGIRFLDDYLSGDKYFRTSYPEHNLVRARCQLALSAEMEKHYNDMCRIVEEIAAKYR